MARTIEQRELSNDIAEVIAAVAAGAMFIVTRNGEPVAELRPIRSGRRTFISRDDVATRVGSGVRLDHEAFRADSDGLLDQSV